MGDFQAGGGELHPGKPIIWPTGKPVASSPNLQTSGGVSRAAPARPGEVAPAPEAAPAPTIAPAAPARPAPSVARPLTIEDIRTHLLNNQIEPNDFNTKLASLMLRNGVEVSRSNFVKVITMLQGTNNSQAMQDAAVLLLMKGIDSPEAVKVLGNYFSDNPGMAAQFMALQEGLGDLSSALGMGKGLMDANLINQLSALLTQFDENFQALTQKFSGNKNISREQVINDVRALKALMQGLQEKAPTANTGEAQVLSSKMMELHGKLDGVLQNLIAQGILSQTGRSEVNYLYHQIPNAMTTPPKDFEILVKRDGEGKKAVVDPRNTQVVMSMETENMGKMVVSMIVKDNKVYVIFVFSEKENGDQGRSLIAKDFSELQKNLADKNFMITGYQVKVDPVMCSIRPYLIPMLKLEEVLKRIDIEA